MAYSMASLGLVPITCLGLGYEKVNISATGFLWSIELGSIVE